MVSIIRRMRKLRAVKDLLLTYLQKLLGIRLGPGAAVLPPEVTRLHMDFALKLEGGHSGPRKFWRNYLPRLKYHNPAVSMTISRTTNQKGPATMTIHFANPTIARSTPPAVSSTTTAQSSSAPVANSTSTAPTERTSTLNMKYRQESEILSELLTITKAVPIEPTEAELEQIRELEEQQLLSETDSKRSRAVNAKRKRTEAMLAQARGEVAAAREA